MNSFLQRMYASVTRELYDPASSRRMTDAEKLLQFPAVEIKIWEDLLRCTGMTSTFSRAEATITLVENQRYYRLPGNFRQFISFEHRVSSDPDQVDMALSTMPMHDRGPGIEIISAQEGFVVRPNVDSSIAGDWTLTYIKGPVVLHRGTVDTLSADGKTLTGNGTIPTDGGELVKLTDYYNGSMVRIYSATTNAPVTDVVEDFAMSSTKPVFTLRHGMLPAPTGTMLYEVCPLLPPNYDDLYGIDIAMANSGRRGRFRAAGDIRVRRAALWAACKQHFESNTTDRAPQRQPEVVYAEPEIYT